MADDRRAREIRRLGRWPESASGRLTLSGAAMESRPLFMNMLQLEDSAPDAEFLPAVIADERPDVRVAA